MEETSNTHSRAHSPGERERAILSSLKDRALDVALEGITIADATQADNPLIYVNHGFEILTGYAAAEVLGMNCRFLQGPNTDSEAAARIRHAIENRQACVVEILNHHKNGTPFWNRLSITPVRDAEGHTTHFIGVQSDVTDRRRAEEELRDANQEMQRALDAAAQVQRSLLPHDFAISPHVQLSWRLEPSATLAGDILNAFWLDEHLLACYVLDVVGHGVAAALLSVTLSHFLEPPRAEHPSARQSPADVANALNQRFPFESGRQQFFTLLYGILDVENRSFEYVSAGHPPLLHVPNKGPAQVSSATGFPIGIMDRPGYENHRVQLDVGDRLFLYTDGVFEAGEARQQPWGIQGVCDYVATQRARPLSDVVNGIVAEACTRHGGPDLPDDLSVLALELLEE